MRKVARANEIDARNLAMSWGGWEMAITFPPENLARVSTIAKSAGETLTILGTLQPGAAGSVVQDTTEGLFSVNLCGSERFTSGSYMMSGLTQYVEVLRSPFLTDPVEG